jgi:DNA-binding GntR family transcriptional regulator
MPPNNHKPEFGPVKTGSVRSRVVEALREAIFSGQLQPGQALREAHLAASLNVSQASVREALMVLEHAGLVVRDNRETTVTNLTVKDLQERIRLRSNLESVAAVEAASRMTANDFDELQRRLDNIHAALDRDSYFDYVNADLEFHRFIWKMAADRMLAYVLDIITVPLFAFLSIRRGRALHNLVRTVRSHDPIVEALRSRDPEAVRAAIQTHVEGSYERFQSEQSLDVEAAAAEPSAMAVGGRSAGPVSD